MSGPGRIWSLMAGAYLDPTYVLAQLACLHACGNTTTARRVYARLYANRHTNLEDWRNASLAGSDEHEYRRDAFERWLNEQRYTTTDVADILR